MQTLNKLTPKRWSGHLISLNVIKSKFNIPFNVLANLTTNRNVSPECRIRAIGLLREVPDEKFIFLVTFLQEVLQYKSEKLHSAISIINSTKVKLGN